MLYFISFFLLSISLQQEPTVSIVDKVTFKELISDGIPLVDVRRPGEFEAGHIKKAKNINFLADDFIKNIVELDTTKPLLIYCRSGKRSGRASRIMDSLGFKKIYDLKGGYLNWTTIE